MQYERYPFNAYQLRLGSLLAAPKLRTRTIDSVFLIESNREKHRTAPLLLERERYLTYLFEIGTRRERVRNVATMLLHVERLLELESSRLVGMDEVLKGCQRWLDDSNPGRDVG